MFPSFPCAPTTPTLSIYHLEDSNILLIGLFGPKAPSPYYYQDESSKLKIC